MEAKLLMFKVSTILLTAIYHSETFLLNRISSLGGRQ
jgi:hypothetical protein